MFLKNKRILISGLANKYSIAAGIAECMHREGAELAFTYQNERLLKNLEPIAKSCDSDILIECDVADDNSIKKLKHKNCDWIIGNDVSKNDIGFGSEMNAINIYTKENKIEKISKNKKSIIAKKIVSKIVNVLN